MLQLYTHEFPSCVVYSHLIYYASKIVFIVADNVQSSAFLGGHVGLPDHVATGRHSIPIYRPTYTGHGSRPSLILLWE